MPELNPVTRKRLWYIAAFLLIDGIVSFWICGTIPATDPLAFPSFAFAMLSLLVGACIAAMLISTRVVPADMFKSRSRE